WPLDELTAADQALLAGMAQTFASAPGDTIISEGGHPNALLLIEQGAARVEVRGREVATLGPGSLVGEMSFASGDPASATVVVTEPARVARVPAADVVACEADNPGFSARLYRSIARIVGERLQRQHQRWFDDDAALDELPVFTDGFEELRAAALPAVVEHAIERYERVGDARRAFLWRWAWHGIRNTQLSVVPERWREHVDATKLLAVVVNVLFDDLADVPGRELEFQASIDRLMNVSAPPSGADIDGPYFQLLFELWQQIEDRARELPGWEHHRLLWRFDYEQVFSAMRYVVLTRRYPGLDNLTEHRAYLPHSMNIMVFATLDLMAASDPRDGNSTDIGLVREIAWHAQALTQIANMVVTWRREVPERDFSSRVFVLAVDRGILTRDELATLPAEDVIARIDASGVEQRLLEELRAHRRRVAEVTARGTAIDLEHYERGMNQVLAMGLAARGLL
ncbi:MAG: hypothetical protein QOG94_1926, partial [Solirubrobacteraceae bacterium]|nr:hypothetical protein [Solirubrobacteraceae bacterium]